MTAADAVHPHPVLADLARKVRPTKQSGLLPGNSDKVGFWLSPPELLDPLNREFGFTFDACPFPRPAGFDGLQDPWGPPGSTVWVNPPFVGPGSSRTAWARKAIAEVQRGQTVVMINSVDRWIMLLLESGFEFRAPPKFTWLDPKGKPRAKGEARPSMLMIGRPGVPGNPDCRHCKDRRVPEGLVCAFCLGDRCESDCCAVPVGRCPALHPAGGACCILLDGHRGQHRTAAGATFGSEADKERA